ncbi:MAG: hypothetical protein RLP14_02375 [Owenweeksia sp.]
MKKLLTLALLFSMTLMLSYSCSKDDDKYLLKVRVTVNDTITIQNALVHIYAPVSPTFVDYFIYTDENGETDEIKLNNKAIVEIFAGKGTFKGCGFAEIERGPQVVVVDMKAPSQEDENGCDALN